MDIHQSREADKEFDTIFNGLRSKNKEEQTRYALTLKNLVFGGNTGDQYNSHLSESSIYNKLHEITVSKDTELKIATYYSIKAFIELVGGPELETSRIARMLDQMMSIPQISKSVADTLGSLYRPGWSLIATYFSFTCGNAIENLGNKLDYKKLNAILILQSFTTHNPGALYPYIEKIFTGLSQTLKDANVVIRRESAVLLERCLTILYMRDTYILSSRFNRLYDEALENLKSSSTESIHSSFLLFKTLLHLIILSNNNRSLSALNNNKDAISFSTITDKVDDIYNKCWFFKDYKSSTIRIEVIEILPLIAKFNTRIFTLKYLQSITDFYMLRLKKDKDRIPTLYLFGGISSKIGSTNCLLYANSLIAIIENLIHTISGGDSNTTASSQQMDKPGLNKFSSFNPSSHIFAGPGNAIANTSNSVKSAGPKRKDGDFFAYNKFDTSSILNNDPATAITFQNISEYKGLKRYELEKAIFYVLIKLCETLGSKITQVLTLNMLELIIATCNLTKHLTTLMSKLIEFYPNLESFILQKLMNKVTLTLAGTDFIEPGVSIASLNLTPKDRKKLAQKSVIGVRFDEPSGRIFLNGNANGFGNSNSSSIGDEIIGNDSRASELRKKIALYKQPYSSSSAPLSNYTFKDLSSAFNNFTAGHEAYSVSNHTNPSLASDGSNTAVGASNGERPSTHFITIKDMVDLNRARKIRNTVLKDYGFNVGGNVNSTSASNTGVFQALTKLTGLSDDYFKSINQTPFDGGFDSKDINTDEGEVPIKSDFAIDSLEYQEINLLVECFHILKKFHFGKYVSLFEFSRYVTLTYIDHQDFQVRKLAALITTKLFTDDEIINSVQIGSITAVSDVLSKLLLLGIADTNPEIRLAVLESLNARYDPQLAQSDNVRLLMISLNDSSFEVRKVTIRILGRISVKNPAYVVPALRKVLIQYLNNLKYGTTNVIRENSCSLLTCLVSCADMLTKPHINAIMDVLIPLLRDSNKNSVISSIVIKCIGELARVSGESTKYFLDEVIPLIMAILKDNSLLISKEEKVIAIKTLSQLIRSSGRVIDPYFTYPDLLAEIIKIVSDNNVDAGLKKETIKLQGILGALDPYKARELESNYKSIRQNQPSSSRELVPGMFTPSQGKNRKQDSSKQISNKQSSSKKSMNNNIDYSQASEVAKNWGHDELGKDFEQGVDLNEMLNINDASMRIPKLIQMETPIDLLLLMQLNNDLRPLSGGEDYYLIVVLNMLVRLLKDQSTSSHHETVMSIIVNIFSRIRDKCLSYSKLIIVGMLRAIKNYTASKMKLSFQQIGQIAKVIGKFIRPAVPELLKSVNELFGLTDRLTLINLVEIVSKNLDMEFKLYLPNILCTLLEALNNDDSKDKIVSRKIIKAFVSFGGSIEEYSNLIITNILRFVQPNGGSYELRKTAIEALGQLTTSINLTDMSSSIIHPFLVLLKSKNPEDFQLRDSIMNSLCALIVQMKSEYFIFLPIVDNTLSEIEFSSHAYTKLVHQLIKNENVSFTLPSEYQPEPAYKEDEPMKKVDGALLQSSCQPFLCKTKGDWIEWLKRLNLKLLELSPSVSLNSCLVLAYAHVPVARELFNAAFSGVWVAIGDEHRNELGKSLLYALQNAPNSSDVLQTILNLAEFMEHNNTPLPINLSVLSKYSFRHHAFAKALHYKEVEFKDTAYKNNVSVTTIDSLININNSLQQSDSGDGMLKIATDFYHFEAKESWYQKLQKWNEALRIYEKKLADNQVNIDVINGKMSCMHALGQWEQLESFTEKNWGLISNINKEKVAPLAAAAAWGTAKWEKMDDYISVMKQDSANKYFFDAILNVHRCNYGVAQENIRNARELLSGEITALINESYSRAYDVVVRIQMLSDLEEIIEFKGLDDNNPRKSLLKSAWDKRLFHCQGNVDIWQRLLNIRSLVIKPEQDLVARIKFANLCRKSGRNALAEKTLSSLKSNVIQLKPVPGNSMEGGSFTNPALVYAQLKLLWEVGQKEKAFATLCTFTYDLSAALCLQADQLVSPKVPEILPCDEPLYYGLRKILCKCFLKQGQWQMELNSHWTDDKAAESGVLGSFLIPTILYSDWYKGWHYWALANYEVISSKSTRLRNREDHVTPKEHESGNESELVKLHAIPAMKGFFRSIELSSSVAIQDLLRLLGLWFAYGGYPFAATEIEKGINDLSIETWLQVLPQLFSRLHHPDKVVNNALQKLVVRLAEVHPQALLFPLNVSVRSDKQIGQATAGRILNTIKFLHPRLVTESEVVVYQLIQVALLLNERWFHAIEDGVALYQSGHHYSKIVTMFDTLYQEPKRTFHEKTFWAIWGPELSRGYEWIVKYKKKMLEQQVSDPQLLQSAFDCLAPIHNKLSNEFSSVRTHFLEYVAPQLLESTDLDLAVPGTYEPGKVVVGMHRFENRVPVIVSKQRPRRFFIYGQDGRLYDYLLKGQEDIRQDNMVMQLFGLVNKLLDNDPECFSRHLSLEPYPTIPLSPKSGLLGWVPNSDTFHTLISQNRNFKGITKDIERRAHNAYSGKHFDFATALRRLELFLVSLSASRGMDIYDVLWLKSRSSEVWLERRTTYIRSLALTSIVGYVLGLGDRHPSNIMIHRVTGKVVHIDYGDCFESASLREKWPEQVPFRLTRMLVNALEASGIEGSFRITLDNVMRVVRVNKESLLALFDSFANDPLIKWGFDIPNKAVMRKTGYKPIDADAAEMRSKGQINDEQYDAILEENERALMNARAEYVLKRINDKLTGNDFPRAKDLDIGDQVDRLIAQATDKDGLALHFIGWCSFW
ncbi:phosphatidylinositol kinase-related protein kinase [Saccharomycopsis crataegensis]|uniref:Serine/threonine-protein kinase TOR n=1 Tax=Saccharomycopsis crataegensis TaxID=43959 RepID=A0AAV5QKM8_9ASCO|nr:phosphatidylinositol kinase-related protein kinase [Saccharomycopsis crataegensis]